MPDWRPWLIGALAVGGLWLSCRLERRGRPLRNPSMVVQGIDWGKISRMPLRDRARLEKSLMGSGYKPPAGYLTVVGPRTPAPLAQQITGVPPAERKAWDRHWAKLTAKIEREYAAREKADPTGSKRRAAARQQKRELEAARQKKQERAAETAGMTKAQIRAAIRAQGHVPASDAARMKRAERQQRAAPRPRPSSRPRAPARRRGGRRLRRVSVVINPHPARLRRKWASYANTARHTVPGMPGWDRPPPVLDEDSDADAILRWLYWRAAAREHVAGMDPFTRRMYDDVTITADEYRIRRATPEQRTDAAWALVGRFADEDEF